MNEIARRGMVNRENKIGNIAGALALSLAVCGICFLPEEYKQDILRGGDAFDYPPDSVVIANLLFWSCYAATYTCYGVYDCCRHRFFQPPRNVVNDELKVIVCMP